MKKHESPSSTSHCFLKGGEKHQSPTTIFSTPPFEKNKEHFSSSSPSFLDMDTVAPAAAAAAANTAVVAVDEQEVRALGVLKRTFGHDSWRPGQWAAISSVLRGVDTLVVASTGMGKCWGATSRLLLFDGTSMAVKDICDTVSPLDGRSDGKEVLLMGDDNTPRRVLPGTITRGNTAMDSDKHPAPGMYRVTPTGGRNTWTCNGDHVLVLRFAPVSDCSQWEEQGGGFGFSVWSIMGGRQLRHGYNEWGGGKIEEKSFGFATREDADKARALVDSTAAVWECTVNEYLAIKNKRIMSRLTMFQPELVQFHIIAREEEEEEETLAARVRGLDPTTCCSPELVKHTAREIGVWLSGNKKNRPLAISEPVFKQLLASYGLTPTNKHVPLSLLADSKEVRRDLLAGLLNEDEDEDEDNRVSSKERRLVDGVVHLARGLGFSPGAVVMDQEQQSWSTAISSSGNDGSFAIQRIEHDMYYGFQIDGNGRCLMDDFVVTHNTSFFQIPGILMCKTSLVISPLISLQKDQVDNARAQGITACALNSANEEPDAFAKAVNGRVSFVYLAPERAVLFLDQIDEMLKRGLLGQLIVDEAHLVSQCGAAFRPEYKQLKQIRDRFPQLPIIAVTATATPDVIQDIVGLLGMRAPTIIMAGFDRFNLSYDVREVVGYKQTPIEMAAAMRKYLVVDGLVERNEACLVYCNSKKDTELVAAHYQSLGIKADYYHAGMSAERRKQVHEDFMAERLTLVAATTAFGCGIDRSDVRLVLLWGHPTSLEEYVQLVGRAGRDGAPARSVIFHHKSHANTAAFLVRSDGQPRGMLKLEQVKAFLAQNTCRRETLLRYFNETPARMAKYVGADGKFKCNNCDCCQGRVSVRSVPREAHSILRASIVAWRIGEAARTNVPPFRIISEDCMSDLTARRPLDTDHLLMTNGIGDYKARQYGAALIKLINDYCVAHDVSGNVAVEGGGGSSSRAPTTRKRERAPAAAAAARVAPTATQSLDLFRAGATIEQIAAARELQPGTILDHLSQCAEAGQGGIRVDRLPVLADLDAPVVAALRANGAATLTQLAASLKQVRPTGNLEPADWLSVKASRLKFFIEAGKWGDKGAQR